MPKSEERQPELDQELERLREETQRQVSVEVWDRCPMKQYVRRYGWLEVVEGYVRRRLADGVDRPLRYLTIPGANASDIGVLWRAGLIVRDANGFPYVAICDKESAHTVSRNLGQFLTVSDRWFHEAIKRELRPHFPFDVINMDLCGAVVTGTRHRDRAVSKLATIKRIFELQRGQSFVVLLTTSTDAESGRQYLEQVLVHNFDEEAFKHVYAARYGALDLAPFQGDYRGLVRIVLPKVIGWMARERGYGIVERFAGTYGRDGHRLICLSLECEPLGRREQSKKYEPRFRYSDGLTEQLSRRVRGEAEEACDESACRLVRSDPVDIPGILAGDANLEGRLREEADSLIGWWHYDRDGVPL